MISALEKSWLHGSEYCDSVLKISFARARGWNNPIRLRDLSPVDASMNTAQGSDQ